MNLRVDPEKCTECGRCTAVCALVKVRRINPLDARIRIIRNWPEIPAINVCRFDKCEGQPCIAACPFDAIKIIDGAVQIVEEDCKGCTKCVPVCPYDAIRMNEEKRLAFKCDLCGGKPACVPECVTGALTVEVE